MRMLDEDAIIMPDRLRLIGLYVLFKDGLLNADIHKLLLHATLPGHDEGVLRNLELLGARVYKILRDPKPQVAPIFPPKQPQATNDEGLALSRFDPALKTLLDEHVRGSLDPLVFPYTKPDMSPSSNDPNANISSASLRSAKPTWARAKLSSVQPRQRVIVFMAGGATYSEARACYEVSDHTSRDVVLMTSHMLNPGLWLQQLGDLSQDRRRLRMPADLPPKQPPAHLYNKPAAPVPAPGRPGGLPSAPNGRFSVTKPSSGSAPVAGMSAMSLNGSRRDGDGADSGRNNDKYDGGEKKKKHHFFGSKR